MNSVLAKMRISFGICQVWRKAVASSSLRTMSEAPAAKVKLGKNDRSETVKESAKPMPLTLTALAPVLVTSNQSPLFALVG